MTVARVKRLAGKGGDAIVVPASASVAIGLGLVLQDTNTWHVQVFAVVDGTTFLLGEFDYFRSSAGAPGGRWIAAAWLPGATQYRIDVECKTPFLATAIPAFDLSLVYGAPLTAAGVARIVDP